MISVAVIFVIYSSWHAAIVRNDPSVAFTQIEALIELDTAEQAGRGPQGDVSVSPDMCLDGATGIYADRCQWFLEKGQQRAEKDT